MQGTLSSEKKIRLSQPPILCFKNFKFLLKRFDLAWHANIANGCQVVLSLSLAFRLSHLPRSEWSFIAFN